MSKKEEITSNTKDEKQGELGFEIVSFSGDADLGPVENLTLDTDRDTIWASTEQMSKLFGRKPNTITEHVRSVFREGELEEASVARKFRVTATDGKSYSVLHYNLDVILSVGYRVSSRQATRFRQWATDVLKRYILQGYALDERRLDEDPDALRKLAADVRALRTKERNIYHAVRECFKISSSDYEQNATETRSVYAKLQDKFTYAITGQTSSQVIIDHADGLKGFMGLTSTKSGRPTKADATVGKNYLSPDELYILHILCEQFLLFAESKAIRGYTLTMKEMSAKFDGLLEFHGYPIFSEYTSYLKVAAIEHAERELGVYRARMRIQGRSVDGTKSQRRLSSNQKNQSAEQRKVGRPVERPMPEPIPDTLENVARAITRGSYRHQPSKAELNEPIHLSGQSPEGVARIVMRGGAPRREPKKNDS